METVHSLDTSKLQATADSFLGVMDKKFDSAVKDQILQDRLMINHNRNNFMSHKMNDTIKDELNAPTIQSLYDEKSPDLADTRVMGVIDRMGHIHHK